MRTPSPSPTSLGSFLFPFLRSCFKPFRAPSLVFFRLTRVQSMFSRNPHPLRPTGLSFPFFSPVYLLLKLRSALKEIPHKITFNASKSIIEYSNSRELGRAPETEATARSQTVGFLRKPRRDAPAAFYTPDAPSHAAPFSLLLSSSLTFSTSCRPRFSHSGARPEPFSLKQPPTEPPDAFRARAALCPRLLQSISSFPSRSSYK